MSAATVPVRSLMAAAAAPGLVGEALRRQRTNKSVNKSSRARPNKGQYGMGNLPSHLLHNIIDAVNDATALDPGLLLPASNAPAALAILKRQSLVNMRLVSSGWRDSVDSHPFWHEFIAVLRPSAADQPTRGSQSPFTTAHKATSRMCMPCLLLSYGAHRTVAIAEDHCTTMSSKLGKLPTCGYHVDKFCTHCLRVSTQRANAYLRAADTGDQDETGRLRPRGRWHVCINCRHDAIHHALQRDLFECARNGPLLGLANNWHLTHSWREYVYWGRGRVDIAARSAVDEMCLMQQTPWSDLEDDMYALQRTLIKLRALYYESRQPRPPVQELGYFNHLCNRIWGDEFVTEEPVDLGHMYRIWGHEFDSGDYGDFEYHEDCTLFRTNQQPRFWPLLREKLVSLSLNVWVAHRVQNGLWILPSDEVDQFLAAPDVVVHGPIDWLNALLQHPHGDVPAIPNDHRHAGRLMFGKQGTSTELYFLPPVRVINTMTDRFKSVLSRRLEPPLSEIVEWYRTRYPSYDAAEDACSDVDVDGVLELLGTPEPWVEGGFFQQRQQLIAATTQQRERSHTPSDAGGDTVVSDEDDDDHCDLSPLVVEVVPSPRVELVLDDSNRNAHGDFGIRDGWSSSVRDEEDEEDNTCTSPEPTVTLTPGDTSPPPTSPMLGKRKSSDEDGDEEEDVVDDDHERPQRPRLGSGRTSQSSEGSSTTALVTPDESPDLLASTIQLVDEAAPTSAHAAIVISDGPPSNSGVVIDSPKLGKRKSPDDDEIEQRPARRHESSHLSEDGEEDGDTTIKAERVAVVAKEEEEDEEEEEEDEEEEEEEEVEEGDFDEASDDEEEEEEQNGHAYVIKQAMAPAGPKTPPPVASPPPPRIAIKVAAQPQQQQQHPYQPHQASRPCETATRDAGSPSPSSMSSDDYDDSDVDEGVPFVPAPLSNLGPGATTLILNSWHAARNVLRECQCRICERGRQQDANRLFLGAFEAQVLRIA